MRLHVLFAILLLSTTSCYKNEHDTRTIRVEIDFEQGYIWDSDTQLRQPFTASHFGGFLADRKITFYSDIYQFLPESVIVNDCEPDSYQATNFNNPSRTILEPSNVIEIAIKNNCFGRIFGTTFSIDVDVIIDFNCI